MATIKSYTDLEQSKVLVKILPLESADGFWEYHDKWRSEGDEWEGYEDYPKAEPYLEYTRKDNEWKEDKTDVPCWSLASLLGVLPVIIGDIFSKNALRLRMDKSERDFNVWYINIDSGMVEEGLDIIKSNPVDTCYEMILKLYDLNLL